MDHTVGVREAKARLSHFIDVARDEGPVVITERGKPVARLTAIQPEGERGALEAALAEMAAEGMIEPGEKPLRKRLPRPVSVRKGVSSSAVLRGMRR